MRSIILPALGLWLALILPAAAQHTDSTSQDGSQNLEKTGDPQPADVVPVKSTDSAPAPEEELSTTYSSIGIQKLTANFDNVKDAINIDSTLIGFRIPTVPWFGVELNLGFTMIPGQVTQVTPGSPGSTTGCGLGGLQPCPGGNATSSSSDFGATTAGIFAVFRSPGKFFGMGKVGYRYLNTSIDELQNDRSGSAWGAGVGYRWNTKGSYAELGYHKWSNDIKALGFSISYSYDRH